jgi:hypothetical protein
MFKTVLNLDHLKIRICFEFRYSNFEFLKAEFHPLKLPLRQIKFKNLDCLSITKPACVSV